MKNICEESANSKRLSKLIEAIKEGNCVAFIGAGFSAPAVRTWDELLVALSDSDYLKEKETVRKQVKSFLEHAETGKTPLFDREAAAELIKTGLGVNFRGEVRRYLCQGEEGGIKQVNERRRLLETIPFDAILTTNFDSKIPGIPLKDADVAGLLRTRSRGWVDAIQHEDGSNSSQVIALHGDINDDSEDRAPLVFSRSGYRQLLFETSNYQSLIRTVFATKTVVFLGFSFSDAYLNLIRSEVLSMLYPKGSEKTIAFAVMDDLEREQVDYLEKYEGISPITYSIDETGDHSCFQTILEEMSTKTDPAMIATRLLSGRKIVWFDPKPGRNQIGVEMLSKHMGAETVAQATSLSTAKDTLLSDDVDLLITHWGNDLAPSPDGGRESNALSLLRFVKSNKLEVPVLVFASGDYADVNRSAAIKLGALDYTDQFPDLFGRIEDMFKGEINT